MVTYGGFNTDTDVPDLSGKVIFITGGTGGVGKTAVLEFAKHNPAHIFFTGRNQKSADSVLAAATAKTKITFLKCELTSLESVKEAAAGFTESRLDIFVANAGIMAQPLGTTADGYEVHFGINHMGNTAMLLRLLPIMVQTTRLPDADVRFVALTSQGALGHPPSGIEFETIHSTQANIRLGPWGRYGQSKLANVLTAKELARRYPKMTGLAIHPGVVKTELVTELGFWHRMLVHVTNPRGLMTPEEGCVHTVWASTAKGVKEKVAKGDAGFFEPIGQPRKATAMCHDMDLAKKLWEWTEEEVGVKAPAP